MTIRVKVCASSLLAAGLALAVCSAMAAPPVEASKTVRKKPQLPGRPANPTPRGAASVPAKVQLVLLASPGSKSDEINEALEKVHGHIVDTTSDGKRNTFYLVEVDRDTYAQTYTKLSKDKLFASVQLNKGYTKQPD